MTIPSLAPTAPLGPTDLASTAPIAATDLAPTNPTAPLVPTAPIAATNLAPTNPTAPLVPTAPIAATNLAPTDPTGPLAPTDLAPTNPTAPLGPTAPIAATTDLTTTDPTGPLAFTPPPDKPSAPGAPGLSADAPPLAVPTRVGGRGEPAGSAGGDARELERVARAGLSRVVEPGDPAALEAFDGLSAREVWDLLRTGVPRVERWANRLANTDPERDLERVRAVGGRFVIPGDDEWPEQVEVLADAGQQSRRGGVPFGLWVRGPVNLREALAKSVAVVGSRACSSYGEHAAAELAAGLADNEVTVVSGGAYGIDAAAHRGALAGSGVTIAVLACGVDVCYPKRNTALFDRIAVEGLLVSELPPGCSPTKLRFLARNRLIAASTLGTLVVEAAVRSGALNSAGWAEQCGRAVLAVPGPITSRMSEGAHLLVRERNAVLVTSIADILEAISPLGAALTSYPHAPAAPTDGLDLEVQRTLDAVPVLRPAPAQRIAVTAGLDTDTVQECLETLADADLIEYADSGWRLSPNHRRSLGTA
ncbi:DNA-processing protein DprA [Kribbella monticola]|uniref:DNA-processing protein DprA n=1 Tax=Kribbella monticola TaxID=2185285 RepID=UPI001E613BA9|nr:DNA-processing protein DprA [Kribbella monticola]